MNLAIELAPDEEYQEMYGYDNKLNEAQAFIDQHKNGSV